MPDKHEVDCSSQSSPTIFLLRQRSLDLDKIENKDYQLILRIPIEARDDPHARAQAKQILERVKGPLPMKSLAKLQRLAQGAPPEGVKL